MRLCEIRGTEDSDKWNPKSSFLTRKDIASLRILRVSFNPRRRFGKPLTKKEARKTAEAAVTFLVDCAEILGSEDYLSLLVGGHGASVLVALDNLPLTDESQEHMDRIVDASYLGYSTKDVVSDRSVSDPNTLIPLAGTKEFGRMVGIRVPDEVLRLSMEQLKSLADSLWGRLPEALVREWNSDWESARKVRDRLMEAVQQRIKLRAEDPV